MRKLTKILLIILIIIVFLFAIIAVSTNDYQEINLIDGLSVEVPKNTTYTIYNSDNNGVYYEEPQKHIKIISCKSDEFITSEGDDGLSLMSPEVDTLLESSPEFEASIKMYGLPTGYSIDSNTRHATTFNYEGVTYFHTTEGYYVAIITPENHNNIIVGVVCDSETDMKHIIETLH